MVVLSSVYQDNEEAGGDTTAQGRLRLYIVTVRNPNLNFIASGISETHIPPRISHSFLICRLKLLRLCEYFFIFGSVNIFPDSNIAFS